MPHIPKKKKDGKLRQQKNIVHNVKTGSILSFTNSAGEALDV